MTAPAEGGMRITPISVRKEDDGTWWLYDYAGSLMAGDPPQRLYAQQMCCHAYGLHLARCLTDLYHGVPAMIVAERSLAVPCSHGPEDRPKTFF